MTHQLIRQFLPMFTLFVACAVYAQDVHLPFVHPLFTDHMVLQREVKAPIWGWTKPGATVTVRMGRRSATALANAEGKWLAKLGPFPAGGPYTLTVTGPTTVTFTDVLVGDVWLCAGQSNMQMGINLVNGAAAEVAAANHPQLRLFTPAQHIAFSPQTTTQGHWQACTPETVVSQGTWWGGFSAAGYFFGRQLQQDMNIPIGLMQAAWGGTVAEAWASEQRLSAMPDFTEGLAHVRALRDHTDAMLAKYHQDLDGWWKASDPGSATVPGWENPALDDSAWPTMAQPSGGWKQHGLPNFDGIVWFRRKITLPAEMAGKDLRLLLGPIDDCDVTYFNGVRVGGMDAWNTPRCYTVPGTLVKTGDNYLAVRVLEYTGGGGGMWGGPQDFSLSVSGGDGKIPPVSLVGDWHYQAGKPLNTLAPLPSDPTVNPNTPTVLHNGMIAPLQPFAIKGVIWYQGESNTANAMQYRTLLPALIADWRRGFGVGDFTFLIVQLANFAPPTPQPEESNWAQLREAQRLTAQTVKHTGLAVAIDIGDAEDIHPKNKQELGRRLALAAEKIAYGKKVVASGPVYRRMFVQQSRILLEFDPADGELRVRTGGKLSGFAIAGKDGKYVWADAVIDGHTIIVSAQQVPAPVSVRYGWANNPVCNLVNEAGLPASPFCTNP